MHKTLCQLSLPQEEAGPSMSITKENIWVSASTGHLHHYSGKANCMLFNPTVCPVSGKDWNKSQVCIVLLLKCLSYPTDKTIYKDHSKIIPYVLVFCMIYIHMNLHLYMYTHTHTHIYMYITYYLSFLTSREILTKNNWRKNLFSVKNKLLFNLPWLHFLLWLQV